MKPEEEARKKIDALLEKAGWLVQDHKGLNLGGGMGVAVREFPLKGAGFADYLLFVERHAVGVVEAKPEGTTLSGVSEQTEKYLRSCLRIFLMSAMCCLLPMKARVSKPSLGIYGTPSTVPDEFLLFICLRLCINGYIKKLLLEADYGICLH